VARRFAEAVSRSKRIRTLDSEDDVLAETLIEAVPQLLQEMTSLNDLRLGVTIEVTASRGGSQGKTFNAELTELNRGAVVLGGQQTQRERQRLDAFLEVMKVTPAIEGFSSLNHNADPLDGATALKILQCESLRRLTICLDDSAEDVEDEILECIRWHGNLVHVNIGASFWGRRERSLVAACSRRNASMPEFVASSAEQSPISLLPKACAVSLECQQGPAWVYRLLSARQEDEIGLAAAVENTQKDKGDVVLP
jgi:hypothetical protein